MIAELKVNDKILTYFLSCGLLCLNFLSLGRVRYEEKKIGISR